MSSEVQTISGWGRWPTRRAEVIRAPVERVAELLGSMQGSLLARGLGRSYGDAALAARVLELQPGLAVRAFDTIAGAIEVEASMRLDELVAETLPRGWFPPVLPGTRFVTIGGAIAADVHGKNHRARGCFGAWVDWIELALASGEIVTCSKEERSDLFHATIGGMGLTGVIAAARLRLVPAASGWSWQRAATARDLHETLAVLDEAKEPYKVAWVDAMAPGGALGRGVVFLGDDATRDDHPRIPSGRAPVEPHTDPLLSVPEGLPFRVLGRAGIRMFNELRWAQGRRLAARDRRLVHYSSFYWPLDGLVGWNRLYGPDGFVQIQCALPPAAPASEWVRILEGARERAGGAYLAVLKVFGPKSESLLSFPTEGATLALDLPRVPALEPFAREVHRRVAEAGGRFYLAKDALLLPEELRATLPELPAFLEVKSKVDPENRFRSDQSDRLGITPRAR